MSLFNDFLGLVEAPLLLERAGYDEMFNDVTRILGAPSPRAAKAVEEARKYLRKNDRVTWYLRLWKIGFLASIASKATAQPVQPAPAVDANAMPAEPPASLLYKKMVTTYAHRARMSENDVAAAGWTVFNDHHFLISLEHYLSLPIAAVQRKVFSFDDPERVIEEFRKAEKTWQEEAKDAFMDDEAEVLIKFPNGLAWYNLNRAYCEKEAKAMGHCGNSPRSYTDDTILSLRKTMTRAATQNLPATTLHKPILTFILNGNGYLTEMKGRFNEKPEPEYHNEIVALLRNPIVVGIRGGGYAPENNFSMNDLDEATKDALVEEKPELGSLYDSYLKNGIENDHVMSMLEERLNDANASPATLKLSDDKKTFTIQQWKDFSHFVNSVDDGICVKLMEIIDGEVDGDEVFEEFGRHEIMDIISHLHDADYHKLMRALEVRPVAHNDVNFQKAITLASQRLMNSAYYDLLIDSANAATGTHDFIAMARSRLNDYIDCGWSFSCNHVWVDVNQDNLDDPVSLCISVDDMVRVVTADEDQDDDYSGELNRVAYDNGWDTFSDYMTERRQEEGLSPELGYRAKLNTDPKFKGNLRITQKADGSDMFDPRLIGRRFMQDAFEKTPIATNHGDLFGGRDQG